MIQQVIAHKDRIKEATDQLSEVLCKAKSKPKVKETWKLDDESSLQVRKIAHELVEEISIIGGFCDGWTKNYIKRISPIIAGITAWNIDVLSVSILELFGTMVNSIIVDFTKTPFRLSELKPILSVIKNALNKG